MIQIKLKLSCFQYFTANLKNKAVTVKRSTDLFFTIFDPHEQSEYTVVRFGLEKEN